MFRRSRLPLIFVLAVLPAIDSFAQPIRRGPKSTFGPTAGDDVKPHSVSGIAPDTFAIRMTPGQGSRPPAGWNNTVTPEFVNVPRMSASFVAREDGTNVVATFSAEAYTTVGGHRLFVRALVDGAVAEPANVVFTEGTFLGARSIEFAAVVDAGIHTVEIQWQVDPGARAYLRGGSVKIRQGKTVDDAATLAWLTPDSGPSDMTTVSAFTPVPGTTLDFYVPSDDAKTIVSFSGEMMVQGGGGKNLWVRAVIDGVPGTPGDVVATRRSSRQVHLAQFAATPLAAGWHTVRIEWQVSAGGIGILGDRLLAVSSRPTGGDKTHKLVSSPSGKKVSTSDSAFVPVPNLGMLAFVPDNGEIAVTFSGEVQADPGASLSLRLKVGSTVVDTESIVVAAGGLEFESQSFAFDRKHVFTETGDGGLYGITLEWSVTGGAAAMGDRAMEVLIEPGSYPDLAESPEFGLGTTEYFDGQPIEAAIGTRPVLTIIHRVVRDHPNDVIPTVAEMTDALFGAHGLDDYYLAMSGGRFTFANAGVLAYDALKSEDHYWEDEHAQFDCNGATPDGFTGGHQERWTEAILGADDDVDFAAYDRDLDGVVDPTELSILVVAPQLLPFGTRRILAPYCNGDPVVVDGVEIREICEWFTSDPAANMSTAAHELGHLALGTGDMYVEEQFTDIEPGSLSLMGENHGTTSHFDAFHKLALGWLTPVVVTASGPVDLEDVKTGGTALILPRLGDGDGLEYFILETRMQAPVGDPLFDEGHGGQGVVIWHVVESPTEFVQKPLCMDDADWFVSTGNLRRGIRLIRPGITAASGAYSSWNHLRYDLGDSGEICSDVEPEYDNRRNALRWADGTPSGYSISGWSAPGPTMSFFLTVP